MDGQRDDDDGRFVCMEMVYKRGAMQIEFHSKPLAINFAVVAAVAGFDRSVLIIVTMNRNDVSFFCRVDDLKTLIDLISCLYIDISKDTECDIEVTPESFFLRVMGKGRNCQGRISVGLPLFREFYCDAEGVSFSVSLAVFVDCLKLFGAAVDSTSATLSFSVRTRV